jgi:predicted adenylyl cyclase CyaB
LKKLKQTRPEEKIQTAMKNLELKVRLSEVDFKRLQEQLADYFVEILHQTDVYFVTSHGRLKLRQETGKQSYLIHYERPNEHSAKFSEYRTCIIPQADHFLQVMEGALIQEVVVSKDRHLYQLENARLHLDQVQDLGYFLEIEIVLYTKEQALEAADFMDSLELVLSISQCEKISYGYRELLLASREECRSG